jgi:hypothetical protein
VKFCPGIPDSAKRILDPSEWGDDKEVQRCIAKLAGNEQMREVWAAVRGWEEVEIRYLIHSAVHFATPTMLSELMLPSERRVRLSGGNYDLWNAAKLFADALEKNREQANAHWLWSDSVEDMLRKLRAFAQRQFDLGFAQWESLAEIAQPNRRGKGDRREIAYGSAMSHVLDNIRKHQDSNHKTRISRSRQDDIIATLTGVIFGRQVDSESIRARRQRKRRKAKAS